MGTVFTLSVGWCLFRTADSCIHLQLAALKNESITETDITKICDIRGSVDYKSCVASMSLSLSKANKSQKERNMLLSCLLQVAPAKLY